MKCKSMRIDLFKFKLLLIYTLTITILCLILILMAFNRPVERVYMTSDKIVLGTPNVDTREFMTLCSTSSVKTYMSYKAITSKSSAQYKYIKANMSVNDKGLLVDKDGYIGIALGSAFNSIGSKYIITLDTGIVLKVVKVESKSDKHTFNGCQQRWDTSVIEFVLDIDIARKHYNLQGNMNINNEFKGKIESIEVVR